MCSQLEPDGTVPVYMYRDVDVIKSGGVELRGMKASLAPRRQQSQASPKLERYTFVPYVSDKVSVSHFPLTFFPLTSSPSLPLTYLPSQTSISGHVAPYIST